VKLGLHSICQKELKSIVTDLINALPGSSSLNTVHYAAIEEAVFSISSAQNNIRNGVLCDQLLGFATVLTIELLYVWRVPRLDNEIPRITKAVESPGGFNS
jgi:hypothetical protein